MSDCTNVEMRESLPELLHGQLSGAARAQLEAHLASCSDCRAELELLQTARASIAAMAPGAIDTRAIVAALPRPRARWAPAAVQSRSAWRIAAAVTVIALGGLSLNVVRQYSDGRVFAVSDSTRDGAPAPDDLVASADTPVTGTGRPGVTGGVGVTDLADEDLEALIGALDQLEAAPHVDPEANRFSRMVGGTIGGD